MTTAMTTETPSTQSPPKSMVPIITMGVCGAMLVAYLALSLSAVMGKAITYDEHVNAVGGYMVRFLGDYRVDVEDGALNKWWSMLNQTRSGLNIDPTDPLLSNDRYPGSASGQGIYSDHDLQFFITMKSLYGTAFFGAKSPTKETRPNGPAFVNRSRQMFALLTALGGAMLAWFAYRLAGASAAIVATTLYCFDPNLLAHGPLVKNDVSLGVCLIGFVAALWAVGEKGTLLRVFLLALAIAASVTVKFSGLLFVFMLILALGVRCVLPVEWSVLNKPLKSIGAKLAAAVSIVVVVGLFTWGFIWACYGFKYSPDGTGKFDFTPMANKYKMNVILAEKVDELRNAANGDASKLATIERDAMELVARVKPEELAAKKGTLMMSLLSWVDAHKLLPNAWTAGLFFTYSTTNMRGGFLMGEYSVLGWWYFFPLAMLFKTPTATILAGITAFVGWAVVKYGLNRTARLSGLPHWTLACLLIPAGIYVLSALTTKLNIGVRHMLPLYPLIFLGIGIGFARLLVWTPRFAGASSLFLACGLLMECFTSYPNYLTFFNAPSGGSDGGVRLLSDSNIDWGQDLTLLAKWQEKNDTLPLYVSYFGLADPSWYDLHVQHLPGSWPFAQPTLPPQTQPAVLAISVTNLQGTYATTELRKYYAEFWKKVGPREVLGGSIYLYDWPPRQ
jgi:uncharacterized membrane protein YhdT